MAHRRAPADLLKSSPGCKRPTRRIDACFDPSRYLQTPGRSSPGWQPGGDMSQTPAVSTVEVDLPHLSSGKVRSCSTWAATACCSSPRRHASRLRRRHAQAIPTRAAAHRHERLLVRATSDICPTISCLPPPTSCRGRSGAGRGLRGAHGRRKLDMLPVEFVVRATSSLRVKDYQRTGAVCGIPLPEALVEADKLPELSSFSPPQPTKATVGHDEKHQRGGRLPSCARRAPSRLP